MIDAICDDDYSLHIFYRSKMFLVTFSHRSYYELVYGMIINYAMIITDFKPQSIKYCLQNLFFEILESH